MRPYAFGRRIEFCWLPVPSTVPVVNDPARVREARARYTTAQGPLVGHFGTYGLDSRRDLEPLIAIVLRDHGAISIVLMGRESDAFLREILLRHPEISGRVHAAGTLSIDALSVALQACDVLVQRALDNGGRDNITVIVAGYQLPQH